MDHDAKPWNDVADPPCNGSRLHARERYGREFERLFRQFSGKRIMRSVGNAMACVNFGRFAAGFVDVSRPYANRATAARIVWQPEAVRGEDEMPVKHGWQCSGSCVGCK